MIFPKLAQKNVHNEVDKYSEFIKDCVIYEYLFNNRSHRDLDKNLLTVPERRQGYVAMGILHSFGLIREHKGIFYGKDILDVIESLNSLGDDNVKRIADSLFRHNLSMISMATFEMLEEDVNNEYKEGVTAYRQHKIRERSPKLIKDAKKRFASMNNGALFCEACGFNFNAVYGPRGSNYIEGHHKLPISEMCEGATTKMEDIVMLCSNCHRIIHKMPMITVDELKKLIANNQREV